MEEGVFYVFPPESSHVILYPTDINSSGDDKLFFFFKMLCLIDLYFILFLFFFRFGNSPHPQIFIP